MTDDVPGLHFIPDHFSESQCLNLTRNSIRLFHHLENESRANKKQNTSIPQPEFVRSQNHNLPSEEKFTRLQISDGQRDLRCEYFPTYGEDGHSLGYFRGNANIPSYVADDCIPRIESLIPTLKLADAQRDLTWRLTMNFYRNKNGNVAGFPFHVDIPANGIVTMILNIQKEATFQIAKDSVTKELRLPVGALLILSGESRYSWRHRVLPEEDDTNIGDDEVQRISLVLGFK